MLCRLIHLYATCYACDHQPSASLRPGRVEGGEHSRAILSEPDYTPARVEDLIAEGVVFERSQASE